ncbi:MAG: iron-containing alcohol dehydrogenase [Acholeplasmatales bacterium]|nr:MAG: iron-containing alcohol dehydrogenase [Acholeplasmatales bacterium]
MTCMKRCTYRIIQKTMKFFSRFMRFRTPEQLKGEGAVAHVPALLKKHGIERVLLVTDTTLMKLGLTNSLIEGLEKEKITVSVFADVPANPTTTCVLELLEAYKAMAAQGMIALGGGSPIDAAKAAAAQRVRPKKTLPQMAGLLKVRKKIPFLVAIPTTAGTGSEGTVAAVITDPRTRHKFAISDPVLIPHVAVLDPSLTRTLPATITAMTGLDALTHAVEAFIGQGGTNTTNQHALDAVKGIFTHLEKAVHDGDDLTARMGMLEASYHAGRAFTRAYIGYIHALAHPLSAFYDIPHGLANAILMPHVLKTYGKKVHKPLAHLARTGGLVGDETADHVAAETFIATLFKFNEAFGFPAGFSAIQDEDIEQMVAQAYAESHPFYPVPVFLDRAQLKALYHAVQLTEA